MREYRCFVVRAYRTGEDATLAAAELSRVECEKPNTSGAASEGAVQHWTEVATIEAIGVFGDQEQLARPEPAAAVPSWHQPSTAIAMPERCQSTAHINTSPEAADEIAAHGRHGLQEVRGNR
jgi:hypothetical protein